MQLVENGRENHGQNRDQRMGYRQSAMERLHTSLTTIYLPRIATLTAGSTHSLKQLFEQHFFVSPSQSPSKMHSSVSEVQTPDGGLSLVGQAPGRGASSHGKKDMHTINRYSAKI